MNLEILILTATLIKELIEAIKANMDNSPDKAKENQEALVAILLFTKKIMEPNK